METSRLEKAVPTHKIDGLKNEGQADIFLRDLTAISEFLFYVEAEPFIIPEKVENFKRVAFKKITVA